MSDYVPLSERGRPEAERAGPFEGVPEWLRSSIAVWVKKQLWTGSEWNDSLVLEVERNVRISPPLGMKQGGSGWELERRMLNGRTDDMTLDVLDFLVRRDHLKEREFYDRIPVKSKPIQRDTLNSILREGGSVWGVGTTASGDAGLVRRVDASFQDAADQAMVGDAQHHRYLRKAWGATYGRNPQPDTAYRDAVRAVEAAAIPIVRPSRSPPTLGLVITELHDRPERFATRLNPSPPLEPIETVRQMLSLLWKSQRDRHGVDDDVPLTVSQQEAEDALALAVTLVRWFDTGAVYRRD